MKDRIGIGEGGSPAQLKAARRRMLKSGALVALLAVATTLAGQIFFQDVADYKRIKGHLSWVVDTNHDGRFDEADTVRGERKNLIINTGESFLVDAWQNLVELEIMRYHGAGVGTVAAAEADTGLGSELTTQLNPDSTRATGTLAENATNIFESVGTLTVDAAVAVTEWGLFSQSATGGGVLFSRVVFSAINLASGDSIQFTWRLTVE